MQIIELLIILFALFAFSRALLRYKDKAMTWKELLFWSLIWLGLILLMTLRRNLGSLNEIIGVDDPFKAIVVICIILLFYLMFRIYVKFDKTEQEITKLTREITIRNSKCLKK